MPEETLYQYGCPDCGELVAEWQDCPECGWYDAAAWTAAVKQRETGRSITMADPLDLGDWR
ncbi:hypothetical protein [Halobacterium bonnevillei]|uniref:Uncharacterized protein n=1 Tax=Halobacterium bonnevillei TaxID=2692200 RepID=A0A6B0SGB3_9EURY|nr:hypothetical protein [Halobacterium bonnevillei]MXR20775.1 hypothetical protein [Halobacterium bonnevillei]